MSQCLGRFTHSDRSVLMRCDVPHMQAGADPRLKATDGMTPVHAAAQMGHTECLAFLVRAALCLHAYTLYLPPFGQLCNNFLTKVG